MADQMADLEQKLEQQTQSSEERKSLQRQNSFK